MLKKFMSFIFEEEEEVVEEELHQTPRQEEPIVIRKPNLERVHNIEETRQESPEQKIINKVPSHMINVDLKPESTKIKKIKADKVTEYEFAPVISPMFGISQSDSENITVTAPKKLKSQSVIGTIISPIYGIDKESESQKIQNVFIPDSIGNDDECVNLSLDEILSISPQNHEEQELDEIDAFLYDQNTIELESEKRVISNQNLSLFDDIEE